MKRTQKRAHSPTPSATAARGRRPPPLVIDVLGRPSDGTLVWGGQQNAPTEEELDLSRTDGVVYKKIPPLSKKDLHWREQLATLLCKHFNFPIPPGVKATLNGMPRGYRLYDQMKMANGKSTRSDAYLYGHPKGPKKRFRSPREFFKHFLWIMQTPDAKDGYNCECDKCRTGGVDAPVAADTPPPQAHTPVPERRETRSAAAAAVQKAPPPAESKPVTRRTAPQRTAAAPAPMVTAPPPAPPAQQAPVAPSFGPVPSVVPENVLLASVTHRERDSDLTPSGANVYRKGEQVWFQTGPHWALGVVIDVPKMGTAVQGYSIHPLHSPLVCDRSAVHTNLPANQLRPWVAWSTPPVTTQGLDVPNTPYELLAWKQHENSPSIEVDASILMSRRVDASYTLIDKLTAQNHYSGVYYGAEKIWVGDTVRLKSSAHDGVRTGTEILVVNSIQDFLNPAASPSTTLIRGIDTGVYITGDLYRLTTHQHPVQAPHVLPQVVIQDLEIRRQCVIPSDPSQPHWTYTSLAHNITVKLQSVKSRWYPTAALFQILSNGGKLHSTPAAEWDAPGQNMNEMGSGGSANQNGWTRYKERENAFWRSIPSGITFKIEAPAQQQHAPPPPSIAVPQPQYQQPPPQQRQPQQQQQHPQQHQQQHQPQHQQQPQQQPQQHYQQPATNPSNLDHSMHQQHQQYQQHQQHQPQPTHHDQYQQQPQQHHGIVDLTADDDVEDDLMRRMNEDTEHFLMPDTDMDDFYGGL